MFLIILGLAIICASSGFNPVVCCIAFVLIFSVFTVDKYVNDKLIEALKESVKAHKEYIEELKKSDIYKAERK